MKPQAKPLIQRLSSAFLVAIMLLSAPPTAFATELEEELVASEVNATEPAEEQSINQSGIPNASSSDSENTASESTPENKTSYLMSFLNLDGIVELTRTYQAGEIVDLSLRLGGGEKQLGWSSEENGEILTSFAMPEHDVVLYPVIDQSTASYQVCFWLENLAGDGYDQADSLTLSGKIDSVVSADSIQESEDGKSYDHFTYDPASSSSEQHIADDGTTVVDIRFKRNSYTLSFDIDGNYRSVPALYYATLRMNIGGTTYTGTQYSFTARFGEDITDRWPTAENVYDNPWLATKHSDYFTGWNDSSGALHTGSSLDEQLLSTAENNTLTLTANWAAPSNNTGTAAPEVSIKYHIYQQNPHDDDYTLIETVEKKAAASSLSKIALDGYPGFHYSHDNPVDGTKKTISYGPWYSTTNISYNEENNVYFDRDTYQLNFKIDNRTIRSESVRYGASLDQYSGYEPDSKPTGRSYFDGWHDNDGSLFAFGSMPAQSVTVTGSWLYHPLSTVTLNYDSNGAAGSINSRIIATGQNLRITDDSALTAEESYRFAGWNTTADGKGTTYAPGDIIALNEDLTLYAIWEPNHHAETWTNEDEKVLAIDEDTAGPTSTKSSASAKAKDSNKSADSTNTSPKTNDTSNIALWTTIMISSVIAIALCAVRLCIITGSRNEP